MLVAIILGLLCLLAAIASIYYFRRRRTGKGYAASAAITGIVSVFTLYVGVMTPGVPEVFISLIMKDDVERLSDILSPSWLVVVGVTLATVACSFLIYRLGYRQIKGDSLPINASAMDFYEAGIEPGLVALAFAHWKYVLEHKPDLPVSSPGDSPYKLPPPEGPADWASLSADMLVQIEPSLDRDSFHYVTGRQLFALTRRSPTGDTPPTPWLVYAAPDGISDQDLIATLVRLIPAGFLQKAELTVVICVQSRRVRDEQIGSWNDIPVRLITESSLIALGIDLTWYVSSLLDRFRHRHLPGTDYALADCFVAPRIRHISRTGETTTDDDNEVDDGVGLLPFLDEWATRSDLNHISIIGEFGQGKSTALLAFCSAWASRWLAGDTAGRIPLLIELRGKSPKRQSPEVFLGEWGQRFHLNGEALYNLVRTGRALLIFEGFDEIQDAGLRFERFQQFKALWGLSFPGTRIIFTGRPNFFLDTEEMRSLLRGSEADQTSGVNASDIYALQFMAINELDQALRPVSGETRSAIVDRCRTDRTFFDIARRPSMLPVIANQWATIRSSSGADETITSALIVKGFIEFLYARKEADLDRLGEYQILTREVRHYFTQRIAWRMVAARSSNTISATMFIQEISDGLDWLDAEFRSDDGSDPVVATSIAELQAKYRGRPRALFIADVGHDVRTYGLLVSDPAGGSGNLYFPHKQYLEYILGETFWMRQNTSKCLWLKKKASGVIAKGLLSEPISLLFASELWPEEDLRRSVGIGQYRVLFDYMLGMVSTFTSMIMIGMVPMLVMLEKIDASSSGIRSRLRARFKSVFKVPIPLRPLIIARPADVMAGRSHLHMWVITMSTLLFLMTFYPIIANNLTSGGRPFGSTPTIIAALSILFTLQMFGLGLLVRQPFSLRTCGLIMELFRFGEIRSLRLRAGSLDIVVSALSRSVPGLTFRS